MGDGVTGKKELKKNGQEALSGHKIVSSWDKFRCRGKPEQEEKGKGWNKKKYS